MFGYNDGSCIEIVAGCTPFNYDSNANQNDGSCIAVVFGCTDLFNYNLNARQMMGRVYLTGCVSSDYNPLANTDDLSCIEPRNCFKLLRFM